MTFEELLDYLDGRGLILTDDDLIHEALHPFGIAPHDQVGFQVTSPDGSVTRGDLQPIDY